jgi:hypothetical protein
MDIADGSQKASPAPVFGALKSLSGRPGGACSDFICSDFYLASTRKKL